jgi:hypothetical protein
VVDGLDRVTVGVVDRLVEDAYERDGVSLLEFGDACDGDLAGVHSDEVHEIVLKGLNYVVRHVRGLLDVEKRLIDRLLSTRLEDADEDGAGLEDVELVEPFRADVAVDE